MNGTCYQLLSPPDNVTWLNANDECLLHGAQLASLNTPREWSVVTHALQIGHVARGLLVGLKTAGPGLPRLYSKVWVWADGTVAYYVKVKGMKTVPACAYFSKTEAYNFDRLSVVSCNTPLSAEILCEAISVQFMNLF